jgi:spore maturation protein CgeB
MIGRAYADRIEPVRAIYERFDTHIYGEYWEQHGLPSHGMIFGEDIMSALNSAKMTMIFLYTAHGSKVVKVGLFDFLAAGALVLTNYFEPVSKYLAYGKEIVGFSSTQELLEKIRYYLDHPNEAQTIREAGRARVLREHTWNQVWPHIVDQVMAARSSHILI